MFHALLSFLTASLPYPHTPHPAAAGRHPGPDLTPFLGFPVLLVAGFFYLLPAVIARKHGQAPAIFLLNLFGWLAGLIGAFSTPSRPVVVQAPRPSVADELLKLQALRDGGTITAAEFDQQKARLQA